MKIYKVDFENNTLDLMDKETLRRFEDMEKYLTRNDNVSFHYVDLVIRDYKGKQAYGA